MLASCLVAAGVGEACSTRCSSLFRLLWRIDAYSAEIGSCHTRVVTASARINAPRTISRPATARLARQRRRRERPGPCAGPIKAEGTRVLGRRSVIPLPSQRGLRAPERAGTGVGDRAADRDAGLAGGLSARGR